MENPQNTWKKPLPPNKLFQWICGLQNKQLNFYLLLMNMLTLKFKNAVQFTMTPKLPNLVVNLTKHVQEFYSENAKELIK